ncbi:5'-nucleotidase [Undibacterium arcticum]
MFFQQQGIEAFERHERENALKPLPEGPFARLLKALSFIQNNFKNADGRAAPIRTALVTARSSPAHERVIRTLRAWDVAIDETFFMGGVAKSDVLQAFKPHMFFFDDQPGHCDRARALVPTGRVPIITQT